MKKKLTYAGLILTVITVLFLTFSYFILRNTPEYNIHRMRGATGNSVYTSPDGHSEAVYDSAGSLVTNSFNMGSYNYGHPIDEPVAHLLKDTLPWLMWGNTRDDPTTFDERFLAYRQDLKIGLRRTLGMSDL